MTHATTAYISAATNRQPHAAAAIRAETRSSTLVAFGSQKFVALWNASDENDRGVLKTLPGHQGEVTCLQWLTSTIESRSKFVSADDKGELRLWTVKKDINSGIGPLAQETPEGLDFVTTTQVVAHERAISAIAVAPRIYCAAKATPSEDIIVTGASDSLVKIWKIEQKEVEGSASFRLLQTIDLKGRYPLAIELSLLPGIGASNGFIMAISATDLKIRIYTRSFEAESFVSSLTLEGHEDWVRCLAFSDCAQQGQGKSSDSEELILASGSQDAYIRLWSIRIRPNRATTEHADVLSDDLLDAFERSLGKLDDDAGEGGKQISNRRHVFAVKGFDGTPCYFTLTFDALLIGHEAGVTSVSWRPNSSGPPTLLSTSTDSSVILWAPTPSSASSASLWLNTQRFGDIGGQKAGGFVGGLWGVNEIMAWGWNGGWRRWREMDAGKVWKEVGAITGHCDIVRGMEWEPKGEYLISASLDQTSRIHGPWRRDLSSSPTSPSSVSSETWHEISRPQVHGYDIVGAVFLDSLRFVSVADEKVARVFEAPKLFVRTLTALHIGNATNEMDRPAGASLPPLGLSNKAIKEDGDLIDDSGETSLDIVTRPPFEGELSASTLWPEVEKLFGHGYELITVASSRKGSLVATACKATTPEHAVIRLYETSAWKPVGKPLSGHTLTVTRIAFSPDDRFVLSVSRDRTWCLFEVQGDGAYVGVATEKAHARIIWDCCWALEGDVFATAARDKTVKIWQLDQTSGKWKPAATIKLAEPATAVDFLAVDSSSIRRLAIGLETGEMVIYRSTLADVGRWDAELTIDSKIASVAQIYRLLWRPSFKEERTRQLALCSEDRTLRILNVHLD